LELEAEKTAPLYELGVKRFFEANGSRRREACFVHPPKRGADAAITKFLKRLHEEGRAPKTIHSYLTGVKAFLKYQNTSYNNRQLETSAAKTSSEGCPSPHKNEVWHILNFLRPTKRPLCWTMWACGLRLDECLSLKVGDIDLNSDPARAYVRGTKTVNARRALQPLKLGSIGIFYIRDL